MDDVIAAQHIRLCFGEARPVSFIGARPQRGLLRSYQPADTVSFGLMALTAIERRRFRRLALFKEVTFVHSCLFYPEKRANL